MHPFYDNFGLQFTNENNQQTGGTEMIFNDGIKELINELKKIDGANVKVNITHKLYGDQNIQVALHLIDNEERLGLLVNEQEIYINKREIRDVGNNIDLWYFADDVMCIKIRKM